MRIAAVLAFALSLFACAQTASPRSPAAPVRSDDVVDYSCRSAADCAVKNVGNCCGAYPACVNRDSPTFPERVKAQCARNQRAGSCGFPAIDGCTCVAGRCGNAAAGDGAHSGWIPST
jgi:hypothetical protein